MFIGLGVSERVRVYGLDLPVLVPRGDCTSEAVSIFLIGL